MAASEAPNGNIGDWSELYTLAYLLVNGGAYGADENQNRIESLYYKVLQVLIAESESDSFLKYQIENDKVIVYRDGQPMSSILRSQLEVQMNNFFMELTNGNHSRHFELSSGNALLSLLSKQTIKASSSETENDLELILEDNQTKMQSPSVGFSIKSQLGSASTLLNSSGSTNIIYRVIKDGKPIKSGFPDFEHGKHRKNLQKLFDSGFELEFAKFQSETFSNNLELLDSNMGKYLARIVLEYYSSEKSKFSEIVEDSYSPELISSKQPIFKIKEFLGAISMGMRPAAEWDGDTTKFKGIILVKKEGDIVFYYLYNRKSFEEYLYKSLKFDRPQTSRHKYGDIYEEDGNSYIKLNLQIRFKK
jgi:type II restriction enzyme